MKIKNMSLMLALRISKNPLFIRKITMSVRPYAKQIIYICIMTHFAMQPVIELQDVQCKPKMWVS